MTDLLICIPLSSMIILMLVAVMHTKHHYSSCICQCTSNDSKTCQLVPIGEKYHTFVPAFLRYTIFIILSCIFVTLIQIMSILQNDTIIVPVLNYIMAYQVLIISIWENSFTFVRYYATRGTTQFYQKISDIQIYKQFSIYGMIFSITYLLQIHLFYWLFPFIVIINVTFNMYYNYQFGAILLKQYKAFQFEDEFIQIVQKVRFLQHISIIYSLSQSLSLTVFIISYNINDIFPHNKIHSQPFFAEILSKVVYVLPVFWCISSSVYAISFVKNQTYFKSKFKCFHHSKKLVTHTTDTIEADQEPQLQPQPEPEEPEHEQNKPPDTLLQSISKFSDLVTATKSVEPTDDELFAAMPSIKKTVISVDPIHDVTILNRKPKKMLTSKSAPVPKSGFATFNTNTPALDENKKVIVEMESLDLAEMERSVNASIEATLCTLHTMKSYGFLHDVDTIKATQTIRKITTHSLRKAYSTQMY